MKRTSIRRCLPIVTLMAILPGTLSRAEEISRRKIQIGSVPGSQLQIPDLRAPEGKSRWDLASLTGAGSRVRTLEVKDKDVTVTEQRPGSSEKEKTVRFLSDPASGDAAIQWAFPDRDPAQLRMGSRKGLVIDETQDSQTDRLRIEISVVGIGWVHLPSAPHEVVLQRVRVHRDHPGSRWGSPDEEGYRWVDPRSGVVAETHGPAGAGPHGYLVPSSADFLEAVIEGASTLKIHVSELFDAPLLDITYGWDRLPHNVCALSGTACTQSSDCTSNSDQLSICGFPVSALTTGGYATMGDLEAASTWDFSGNNSGTEVAGTTTPINSGETCNFGQCGYTGLPAGYAGQLERTDKSFNVPANLYKINDIAQREDRAADVTIWLRSGSQNEGVSGSLGSGESRFCYITAGGITRTPAPLWQFTHLDAGSTDYYFQAGDSWTSTAFNCEQNIFNNVCGVSGFADHIWTKACASPNSTYGTHAGTQAAEVRKGGVITLPSGHTFNALLVRNVADFCVYANPFNNNCTSNCCRDSGITKNLQDEVRTINYLWQVPHLGTVARVQSGQIGPSDLASFRSVAETDIHFGLFPPRTIAVTGTTGTSVSLSWDPGLDTHRITDYKIYWDTDSGSSTAYAFNSVSNSGQVSFAGTTATISGLTPGLTYFFTVTSRSTFTDVSSGTPTTYESILYPTQVSGDPSFIYPIEVQATTPCPATAEVTGVTVTPTAVTGEMNICWTPVADSCLAGYRIMGSNTVKDDTGYTPVVDVGITNCWTGSPAQLYYLVISKGATGNGPWGHYGH